MSVDSVVSRKIHVVQGEYAVVVNEPDTMLTTILGSCVAACIRDAVAGIGGMNHFLLPGRDDAGDQDVRFGVYAMELLINALLQQGASRSRLEAKLFGGARIVAGFSDIGQLNAEFARGFLEKEGIAFAGGSLGDNHARRIQYWPFTGQARQTFIRGGAGEIVRAESRLLARPTPAAQDGVVELF